MLISYHFWFLLIVHQAHSKSQVNAAGCRRANQSWHGSSSKYDLVAIKTILIYASSSDVMVCSARLTKAEKQQPHEEKPHESAYNDN